MHYQVISRKILTDFERDALVDRQVVPHVLQINETWVEFPSFPCVDPFTDRLEIFLF
jgi:hypothetical protein